MSWTTRTRQQVFASFLRNLKDRVDQEHALAPSPFPENWESRYGKLLERVSALGYSAELDEVDEILDPSGSTTHPRCTECGELKDVVLQFRDDEMSPEICLGCLKLAVSQLSEVPVPAELGPPSTRAARRDEYGPLDPPPRPWCWEVEGGNHHWRGTPSNLSCRWCPAKPDDSSISS